jgi:hypothetical protein
MGSLKAPANKIKGCTLPDYPLKKNITMTRFILTISFVHLLNSVTAHAQLIKIEVKEGNKFIVEKTTITTNSAQVMGQTMENKADLTSTTVYEVVVAKADGFDLQSTLTKMKINASIMGQDMNFDSDKKDNKGPVAKEFNNLINKPSSISINPKGEIIHNNKKKLAILEMLEQGTAENEIATDIYIPALINKELKAGYSFPETSMQTKEKHSSKDSGMYTITGIDNGIASVSYTGKQFTTGVMEQMGMEMTTSSNNTVTKQFWVDIKTGIVLMQRSTIDAATDINAGAMVIPSTSKTITTINITRSGN